MTKKCLFLLTLACCAALSAAQYKFVVNGKAACQIVLPANPGKFEKQAAEEFKSFLKQMTGGDIQIIREGTKPSLPAVYIGQTRYAASKGANFAKLDHEEYQLIPAGKNLIITGGRPIGSFYGTWRLLNRMGIWTLTADQDYVPSKKNAILNVKAEKHKPTFSSRVIYDGLSIHYKSVKTPKKWMDRYGLYLLRNGINGRQHHIYSPPYVGKMSDIPHNPLHHTFQLYVPAWKYFKSNPEYFAMDHKGKRCQPATFTGRGGLCLSNPDVPKVMLQSLRAMIKKHRKNKTAETWPVLYDITPLDLSQECKCKPCADITKEEGGGIGLLVRCINYVAENIRKEYPDIVIRTSCYGTRGPKCKSIPASNVIMQIADKFVSGDCFKPLSHKFNAPSRELFEYWASKKCRLALWDYWNMAGYCKPPRMEVVFDTIAPDLRYLSKCGVEGMFIEISKATYKPQNFLDLEYFVASQLMLDVSLDPEMLADVFLKGFYGAAASEMKEFFNELRAGVKKYPHLQPGMRSKIWDYMTPEYLWKTWQRLERAAAKVPAGSRYQRRIHDESLGMLWLMLDRRGKWLKYFNQKGLSRKQIAKLCRERSYAHLNRFGAKKLDYNYKYSANWYHCQNELNRMDLAPLPIPPKFQDVDPVNLRVFGIYQFNPLADYNTAVVDDPDSPTGKALKAVDPDPKLHGVNAFRQHPQGKWKFYATQFGMCNKEIIINPVAQDEKYHWYKIPKCTLSERSWFWGFYWHLQVICDAAYQIDDGISDENLWDCYFSVKFTGPAYVKGSKKENAVWVDSIVLTRPGEKKIRRR